MDWDNLKTILMFGGLSLPWVGAIGALAFHVWKSEGRTDQARMNVVLNAELRNGAWSCPTATRQS